MLGPDYLLGGGGEDGASLHPDLFGGDAAEENTGVHVRGQEAKEELGIMTSDTLAREASGPRATRIWRRICRKRGKGDPGENYSLGDEDAVTIRDLGGHSSEERVGAEKGVGENTVGTPTGPATWEGSSDRGGIRGRERNQESNEGGSALRSGRFEEGDGGRWAIVRRESRVSRAEKEESGRMIKGQTAEVLGLGGGVIFSDTYGQGGDSPSQ